MSRTTALWLLLAAVAPTPMSALWCSGLLSPAIALGVMAPLLAREPVAGWVIAGPVILEAVLLLWLLRWLATRIVTRLPERTVTIVAIVAILVALLPVYSWDCMDGYPTTWCSGPGLVRAALVEGRQCGDLGW